MLHRKKFLVSTVYPVVSGSVLWSRSILARLRLQLVKMVAPTPAPALAPALSSPQFVAGKKVSLFNLPGLVLFTERYECFALLFQYFAVLTYLYTCGLILIDPGRTPMGMFWLSVARSCRSPSRCCAWPVLPSTPSGACIGA